MFLPIKDYTSETLCPCGIGSAMRIFTSFNNKDGLTLKQKEAGVKNSRLNAGEYTKHQRYLRKKEYPPDSKEAISNELWTGREGLDGITKIADVK